MYVNKLLKYVNKKFVFDFKTPIKNNFYKE